MGKLVSAKQTEFSLRDSITSLGPQDEGCVVVSGSHGGVYAAHCAAFAGVRAAVFCDAGFGLDEAGVGGLFYLDNLGIPAVTSSHLTARIGNAADIFARGRISRVNECAHRLGCRIGQSVEQTCDLLVHAGQSEGAPPPIREAGRILVPPDPDKGACAVWGLDSGSLVLPEHTGSILIIGSHGGVPGGEPLKALKVPALLAVFHDAGVGIDEAGISRLPALDRRGIAAAAVDGSTARIGDAISLYETGILSHCNQAAAALGAKPGMACSAFVHDIRHRIPSSAHGMNN